MQLAESVVEQKGSPGTQIVLAFGRDLYDLPATNVIFLEARGVTSRRAGRQWNNYIHDGLP